MPKEYDQRHQEIDREYQRQQSLTRYRRIRSLKKSELALDDERFLKNFEAAMHLK